MRKDVRQHRPTAGDISEVLSGKGSSSDKREMGFVKSGGRLVPSGRSPAKLAKAFKKKRARTTKRRTVRRPTR